MPKVTHVLVRLILNDVLVKGYEQPACVKPAKCLSGPHSEHDPAEHHHNTDPADDLDHRKAYLEVIEGISKDENSNVYGDR